MQDRQKRILKEKREKEKRATKTEKSKVDIRKDEKDKKTP